MAAAGNLNYRTNGALVQTFGVDSLNQLSSVSRSGAYTVAGTTWGLATNVTVADNGNSPVAALRYADGTFARTNVTLVNGTNTFTAFAQDNYGRSDSNTVTAYLPTSGSFAYDNNGNLLTDGQRHFSYDDENQLITVILTNSTRSDFVYDGKMRRRVRTEAIWRGGQWVTNLLVRYVYDGKLVIQERHFNAQLSTSVPQQMVTYTRGRDLSGTLEGAGGIGGLLARTEQDSGFSVLTSSFYHCDGNGNVTMLVNASQQPVARYLYDPYGNTLAATGPLAEANLYRFSSKELHVASGLVYYLYRFYEPSLQRWANRDPLSNLAFGEPTRSGVDISQELIEVASHSYEFVGNRVPDAVDPDGLRILPACTLAQETACIVGCQAKGMGYDKCVTTIGYVPPNPRPVPGFRCYCSRPRMCFYACGSTGDAIFAVAPQGNGKCCQPTAVIDGFRCTLIGTTSP